MSGATAKLCTKLTPSLRSAKEDVAEALKAGAPRSVLTIPSNVGHFLDNSKDLESRKRDRSPGAIIQQFGTTRHIFVPNHHLERKEMDGLAYRIKTLSKNASLNSILLSNCTEQPGDGLLPASAMEIEQTQRISMEDKVPSGFGKICYAFGGYDARKMYNKSADEKRKVLEAMFQLTASINGGAASNNSNSEESSTKNVSKIPFISVPHGLITDGGYAFAMGSFVLATYDSRFRIENPQRGLALDPIGLSYVLPRLGWEFQQQSSHLPVGEILALTGFEADGSDMVETGLATHFIGSFRKLGCLECALAELDSYEKQNLKKKLPSLYGTASKGGKEKNKIDLNMKYRNQVVSNLLYSVSMYDAAGQEVGDFKSSSQFEMNEDPSIVLQSDTISLLEKRNSMLVNIAAVFQDVFKGENCMEGILERMKEFASQEAVTKEDVEFVSIAMAMVEKIEAQSPLALLAVHRLMTEGKKQSETLEKCMEREKKVQLKLFEGGDFKSWAKSGVPKGHFRRWKHDSFSDVTSDELEELMV